MILKRNSEINAFLKHSHQTIEKKRKYKCFIFNIVLFITILNPCFQSLKALFCISLIILEIYSMVLWNSYKCYKSYVWKFRTTHKNIRIIKRNHWKNTSKLCSNWRRCVLCIQRMFNLLEGGRWRSHYSHSDHMIIMIIFFSWPIVFAQVRVLILKY